MAATSVEGLQAALCADGGAEVKVTDDITATTSVLNITNNCVATLDLNGKEVQVRSVVLGTGSDLTIMDSVGGGKLTADARGNDDTAGIQTTGATLRIEGGTVVARGGDASAGIGGGSSGAGGTVDVSGGTVTAIGGAQGAGIGGGRAGAGGTVTISGGAVSATGGFAGAGIGGGSNRNGGTVTISGGTVTATGGSQAAGIGGGFGGIGGKVEISDGTVTAQGGTLGAGIGGGWRVGNQGGNAGAVTISGGAVTATGGSNAAGIGGGTRGNGGAVEISGGTVTATGGSNAAGIGGGQRDTSQGGNGGPVTISGGTVTAIGGIRGAGIGGGQRGNGGAVEISGGTVTAIGGDRAAGIGGGQRESSQGGNGRNVSISGGTVTATGGSQGAGIGGGQGGDGGVTVEISGGVITATAGSDDAQPIGPGRDGTAGTFAPLGPPANDSTNGRMRSISFRVPTMQAGGGESVKVGTAVETAPSVLVEDENGPVEGVTVSFTGDGTVSPAEVVTDDSGIASVETWTLGTTAGAQTLTATVGALSVTFEAEGLAGDPTQLTIKAGDDQSAEIGSVVETPPSVLVRDEYGNPLEGITVTFTGDGTFAPATVDTDASGIASVESWTLGTTAGAQTLTATVGALSVTFEATGRITPTLSVTNPGIKTPFTADFTLEVNRVLPWSGPDKKPTDPALEFEVTAGAEHCSVDPTTGLVSTTGKITGGCIIRVTSAQTAHYSEVSELVGFEMRMPIDLIDQARQFDANEFGEEKILQVRVNQAGVEAGRDCGVGDNNQGPFALLEVDDEAFVPISFYRAGDCSVEFAVAGTTLQTFIFTVSKASQSLAFGEVAPAGDNALVGMTYTPTVSSTRDHDGEPTGLTIPLGIDTGSAAVCEMDGDGVITFLQAGECVITADKDETDNYLAASATQTVNVTAPAPAPTPTTPSNTTSAPSSSTETLGDTAGGEPQTGQLPTPGPTGTPRGEPPTVAGSPEAADEGPATTDGAIGVAPGGLTPPGDQTNDAGGSLTPAPAAEASRDVWEGSVILGFGIVAVALLLGLGLLSFGTMGVFSGAGGSSRFSLPTAR